MARFKKTRQSGIWDLFTWRSRAGYKHRIIRTMQPYWPIDKSEPYLYSLWPGKGRGSPRAAGQALIKRLAKAWEQEARSSDFPEHGPRPPDVPLFRALWSLLDGSWVP